MRTTRWSWLCESLNGPGPEEVRRRALDHLCRIYWPVVRQYIMVRSNYRQDADDLTQDFFSHILSNGCLENVAPGQGLFRSWLLVALRNFLAGDHKARQAQKRGANRHAWSMNQWLGGELPTFALVAAGEDRWSPEKIYDACWALTLSQRALIRLEQECAGKGRARLFETLKGFLTGIPGRGAYAAAAETLGMPEDSVRVAAHRLRQRYGAVLREEVEATVGDGGDPVQELRYLAGLLGEAGL